MRVLWLAGWYPHSQNPLGGNFVKRHFRALQQMISENKGYQINGIAESDIANALAHNEISNTHCELELYHFAPYYKGDNIPKLLEEKTANPNTQNKSAVERIIPVLQFRGAFRALNVFYYYIKVIGVLISVLQRDWDIVHVHAADKIGFVAAVIKPYFRFQLWLTEHWAIFGQEVPDAYEKRGWWFRFSYQFMWKRVDWAASISGQLYESMCSILGRSVERVNLENVLDDAFLDAIEKPLGFHPQKTPGFRFLHVSNGEDRKNVPFLIEAFVRFKSVNTEAELILIGSTTHTQYAHINGVTALGGLPPRELAAYYQNCDALLLVSDAENAPCVILEALCFGLPVIVTQVGSIAQMCGVHNSIQIPPFQTHEEKAEKIHQALLEYSLKNQTFDSMQIQQRALEKYHPNVVAHVLLRAYENQ
jgi:glycosyltransferase involved in cell wall biosynthesis